MYFSLFKETKNFDFYCMFFSAVCVAQGYHITFCGFMKLRIFNTFDYKYRQNLVSKTTNSDKSQTPQFRETAVGRSVFFFWSCNNSKPAWYNSKPA